MTTVYGGDEVNALVLDIGTCLTKVGYAGDDSPKGIFPSHVGVVGDGSGVESSSRADDKATTSKRTLYAGSSALQYRRDNMEVVSPFGDNGLYSDWEAIEKLCSHAFDDRLRAQTKDYALLLAEPSHNNRAAREKTVELMFEKFDAPAVFLAKNAMLSSFATARQTSLVIDAGYRTTTVAAVQDGYVLSKSVAHSPVAGQLMSQLALKSVEAGGATVRPRYSFKVVDSGGGGAHAVAVDAPNTRDSYRRYCVEQIAGDVKESVCRVSDNLFREEENANIPTVAYELPDGNEIHVGPARFKIPETYFQPALVPSFPGSAELLAARGVDATSLMSLPDLVLGSIAKCDVDVRKELYSGVVLTGGTSLLNGLRDRLDRELQDVAPQAAKVKVVAPVNALERRFSVWIGGSILASLGSFQQMWMSKKEFEEHGAGLIHRKSP